jgi:phospholipid/cholesterol/gamma-HCH transport system permease protein
VTEYRRRESRETASFPVPQRAFIIFFRQMSRTAAGLFGQIGYRVLFAVEMVHGMVTEPRTWVPLTVRQMRQVGAASMPLAGTVAAFIGAVTGYQTVYQLFPGVQLSAVGWIVRQSIVLELGPLVTALVLAGRVGARMAAEIGTMRVTEQIDALETLAYDPMAYLVVPRFIAGVTMVPLVTILAIATGVTAGGLMVVAFTHVQASDFTTGLHLTFIKFQVYYALIKATLFGGAIALIGTYEGYTTDIGAEGVGSSTSRTVVISSVVILLLDALTALYLAPQLKP